MRIPAETKAMTLVSSIYRGLLAVKERVVSPAATIAAVAESALTTRCREEPNSANARNWQEERVEAGYDGRAYDFGVAHHLWNAQCCQCDASCDVWSKLTSIQR